MRRCAEIVVSVHDARAERVGVDIVAFHRRIRPCVAPLPPMSLIPAAAVPNASEIPAKRRRTSSAGLTSNAPSEAPAQPQSQSPVHMPKRGARACTACRKGKNRCEGEVCSFPHPTYRAIDWPVLPPGPASLCQPPCRRCQLSGTPCIFEKPEKKNVQVMSNASVE